MFIPEGCMLLAHRATLIQYIREYLAVIRPPLNSIMCNHYGTFIFDEKKAIQWILAEELELIYHLFDKNNEHNKYPFNVFHSELNTHLPIPLSVLTSFHIKAPIIYNDNNTIEIGLTEFDLFIKYYSNPELFKLRV